MVAGSTTHHGSARSEWRTMRRVFYLFLILGALVVFIAIVSTALEIRDVEGSGRVTTRVLGIPLFNAEKNAAGGHGQGGESNTVAPAIGVLILLVVLPAVAAGLSFFVGRALSNRSSPR